MTEQYRRTLFVAYLFLFSASILTSIPGKAQQESSAPPQEQKTFSLNPDDLGALENSVNLFTGQVAFPMSLVSLPDASGLGISVAIQYNSSGVSKQATTWNVEAPTGILGLGWSLELPRIVVDHKQTGTRHDDKFFVVEAGQSIPLVCIKSGSSRREYKPVKDAFWKVAYYPYSEKWEIIKEDGTKFIYGDENSERNTVQWMVKWGNWIGSSTQPSGQQQMAYVWNLSEVENLWGQKLTYTYDPVEEYVAQDIDNLSTEKKHTKASYLKKITTPSGKSVEFIYGEKLPREYQDPHTEQAEPDAYQEKYETRFLDRLVARNEKKALLYEVALDYQLIGEQDLTKRTLTAIRSIYPSGRAMPPLQFGYSQDEDYLGMLKKVTNSYGAFYEYTYQSMELEHLTRDFSAVAPAGFEDPYVWTANDYVVVIWREKSENHPDNTRRKSKLFVYTWDGQWFEEEVTEIYTSTARPSCPGYVNVDAQVTLGKDNFSVLYKNSVDQYRLKLYSRKGLGIDYNKRWDYTPGDLPNTLPDDQTRLLSGEDFVAVGARTHETLYTYVWNGYAWNKEEIDIDNYGSEYYFAASHNYIVAHNDNGGGQDYIHFFFLNEDKTWIKKTVPTTQAFRTDGEGTYHTRWSASPSMAVVLPYLNEEFIYTWNDNYSGFKRVSGFGKLSDASRITNVSNSLVNIAECDQTINRARSARYDGKDWDFTDVYHYYYGDNIGYSEDHLVWERNAQQRPREQYTRQYDPNNRGWGGELIFYHQAEDIDRIDSNIGASTPESGIGYHHLGTGRMYRRSFSGGWYAQERNPLGADEKLVGKSIALMTPNYAIYHYTRPYPNPDGAYVIFYKNGKRVDYQNLPNFGYEGRKEYLSMGIIVAKDYDGIGLLRGLRFHRVMDQQIDGSLQVSCLKTLKWYDGNQFFYNSYDYATDFALVDPSGSVPYFNKVIMVPGSQDVASKPYGSTEHYFFNGLPYESLALPSENEFGGNNQYRRGLLYHTRLLDAEDNPTATTATTFGGVVSIIENSDETDVEHIRFYRNVRAEQSSHGVAQVEKRKYDLSLGLLKEVESINSSGASVYQYYTYWHEVYDALQTNILSPTVKVVTKRAGSYVAASATTWKEWGYGKWAPEKSYSWLRGGSTDFDSWEPGQQPSTSNWKLAQTIAARREQTGSVLESSSTSGLSATSLYDDLSRLLASAQSATLDQIAYTSF